jgi:HEAT repeat protein
VDSFEEISNALQSSDEERRLQGLRALADEDATERLDLVFQAFGDPSWRVRKEAIDLFMRLPIRRELIGEIIELLHAEANAGLRNAAVEILTRLDRDAVPLLLDQAACPDHDVRKFILDILGDIAADDAVPTLVRGLDDEDSNVRAAAAENLGKLRATQAVPALIEAMNHDDLLLKFTILDALSRIAAPVPLTKLRPYRDEKLLRKALIDCLGKVGDESAVAELVIALTDEMRNVREAAILGLVGLAERYPDAVQRQLVGCDRGPVADEVADHLADEGNAPLRRAAIRLLGWLGAANAVEPLLRLLDDDSLQRETLDALVDIGRTEASALLESWPSLEGMQRAYLAYVIGEAGCQRAVPQLRQALAADDVQLVRMSAYALGRLAAVEALPDLVGCLEHASAEVQEAAMQALVALGGDFAEQTFVALQPLLNHEDPLQRMFAVTILRDLDNPAVLDALGMALKDPAAVVRRAAVKIFERYEVREHIGKLLLCLTDEDAEVRRSVVEILANCTEEECLDGLELALRDEDPWVRSSAVRGLGRQGGTDCRALIEASLKDPVGLVSIAALETLDGLVGQDACPQLVEALDHDDEEVVTAAMNLLTSYGPNGWLEEHAGRLINHPFWVVRSQVARSVVEMLGSEARPLLEQRLAIESEAVVRQQLQDLLDDLPTA